MILALIAALAMPQAANAQSAEAALAADYDRTVAELIRITETPAPPLKEAARGKLLAELFRTYGIKDVAIDEVGNVIALRPGTDPKAKLFVISAHLDTVFPEGTPIKVRREGDRLFAPGIGDDSVGLAALLAWARALQAGEVTTRTGILFVATVGEEGEGDLRGVRHLFTKSAWKDRIGAFVSVDGSDASRIVTTAVGSRRYALKFKGPGGHSYGAFGLVNPMVAMADTVRALYAIPVPATPRTTYAASVVSGGTSVNAIPDAVTLQVDMRSPSPTELTRLEAGLLSAADKAVALENAARSTRPGKVTVEKTLIGDRPAGATKPGSALVRNVTAAIESVGLKPESQASSTDSNIAMSLGVPAVTIGTGDQGGRAHSLDEYVSVARAPFVRGLTMGLRLIIAQANASQ